MSTTRRRLAARLSGLNHIGYVFAIHVIQAKHVDGIDRNRPRLPYENQDRVLTTEGRGIRFIILQVLHWEAYSYGIARSTSSHKRT